MAYVPKEHQCPLCDSTRVRQMPPHDYEATSLVTWYECLRCPHIWFRAKIFTAWTAESPERRQSARAKGGQMAKRARPSGVGSRVPKTDKGR